MNKLRVALRSGDRNALSKSITLIESSLKQDGRKADLLLKGLECNSKSIRVGVTGAPGVGKSCLTETFGMFLLDSGKIEKIAVLAIDPSSELTGGSILGDKTRMPLLSNHKNAFIRPTPSKMSLGGVASGTAKVITLCENADFDFIWVETVGIGQSEIAVSSLTDIMILIVAPQSGDDLQGIKKGVTEHADIIVVNKADSEEAISTASFYRQAMSLSNRQRPVVLCSAKTGLGMEELWSAIKKQRDAIDEDSLYTERNVYYKKHDFEDRINILLREYIQSLDDKHWRARSSQILIKKFADRLLHSTK